jgi:hypothetical protein
MHAPNQAAEVWPASAYGYIAGLCRSGCPSNPSRGWFVPYRPVPAYPDAYEAVITLYVKDLSSPFLDFLPFVIDTGTDVTIIPRKLLKRAYAFPPSKTLGQYKVEGLTGKVVVGLRFRAAVAIVPHRPGPDPLRFDELKPIIVDDWKDKYGMLGLDALRQVMMVSDRDHICLWPLLPGPCSP